MKMQISLSILFHTHNQCRAAAATCLPAKVIVFDRETFIALDYVCVKQAQAQQHTSTHWLGFDTIKWQSKKESVCFLRLLTIGAPRVRLGTK